MKYLRKYQENSNTDLKNFCNSHLSYLIDAGFDLGFNYRIGAIFIAKQNNGGLMNVDPGDGFTADLFKTFKWVDIKDEFIPFLELLAKRYNIDTNITIELTHGLGRITSPKQIKFKDLIEDSEYLCNLELRLIQIRIR